MMRFCQLRSMLTSQEPLRWPKPQLFSTALAPKSSGQQPVENKQQQRKLQFEASKDRKQTRPPFFRSCTARNMAANVLPSTARVVVVGGGPIGCLYACFLKQQRPATRIVVLEQAAEPGHKIGESTLSGFCKALRSVGVSHEAQQELFFPKNGLGFFHATESVRTLQEAPEYILETFDETFQVERRVLDTAMLTSGFNIDNTADFAKRMYGLMKQGLNLESDDLLPEIEVPPEPEDDDEDLDEDEVDDLDEDGDDGRAEL